MNPMLIFVRKKGLIKNGIKILIKLKYNMNHEKTYKEVELICKKERIMEKYYNVESFNEGEPYFTTSWETDIREMISDGLEINTIISTIRKW